MEQLARGPGIWRRGCLSNSQSQLRPWVKQQATRPWVLQQDHVFPGLSLPLSPLCDSHEWRQRPTRDPGQHWSEHGQTARHGPNDQGLCGTGSCAQHKNHRCTHYPKQGICWINFHRFLELHHVANSEDATIVAMAWTSWSSSRARALTPDPYRPYPQTQGLQRTSRRLMLKRTSCLLWDLRMLELETRAPSATMQ